MKNAGKEESFDVLGHRLRLKSDEGDADSARRAAHLVGREAQALGEGKNLDQGQLAVLVALKLASEKITLEKEYKEKFDALEQGAREALGLIEDVIPQHL